MSSDKHTQQPNEETSQSVEEFLAAGGQITQVPAGTSGENPKDFYWNQSHYKLRKLSQVTHKPLPSDSRVTPKQIRI